ncbi:MAG: YggS family pyridoxal phosphate-dependent enzyme [Clostridium sp.]
MSIKKNIKNIKQSLPKEVTLVAVSKTKPIEDLEAAYEVGMRDFGENKVQEILEKYEVFHDDVRWHMIGNLQKNKVKYLVGKVYLIHSLSSIDLLKKIELEFSKQNKVANVLIQINIGREDSKGGFLIEELENAIEELEKCSFVKAKGLMVIIPKGNQDSNRDYFKKTKNIFEELKNRDFKNTKMEVLSMGMTNDYEDAIDEGATLIRVGEGIFGKRVYTNIGGL